MANVEVRVDKLDEHVTKIDERLTNLEQQVSNVIVKVDMLVNEMRDRDNQRVEDMREIRASIADMGKHFRNLSLTAMGAIGAMVIAVGAMVVTVVYSVSK